MLRFIVVIPKKIRKELELPTLSEYEILPTKKNLQRALQLEYPPDLCTSWDAGTGQNFKFKFYLESDSSQTCIHMAQMPI